jgi:hypothetical protein
MTPTEQFIDTVDLHQLRSGTLWPIIRVFAPHFVEEIELGRYMRRLLATHRWSVVRVVPHTEHQIGPSKHVFDVYGQPVETTTQDRPRSSGTSGRR